jgi:hypothetical protein
MLSASWTPRQVTPSAPSSRATEEEAELFLDWYQAEYGDPRTDYYSIHRSEFFQRHSAWHAMTRDGEGEFVQPVAESLAKQAARRAG